MCLHLLPGGCLGTVGSKDWNLHQFSWTVVLFIEQTKGFRHPKSFTVNKCLFFNHFVCMITKKALLRVFWWKNILFVNRRKMSLLWKIKHWETFNIVLGLVWLLWQQWKCLLLLVTVCSWWLACWLCSCLLVPLIWHLLIASVSSAWLGQILPSICLSNYSAPNTQWCLDWEKSTKRWSSS